MLRSHPLTDSGELGVAPLLLAIVAGALVVLAAGLVRGKPSRALLPDTDPPLPRWAWATRAIGLALLVVTVGIARFGPRDELANFASPLVGGLLWPVVLGLSIFVGPLLWRALDPVDTLLRVGERATGVGSVAAGAPSSVWPAVGAAAAWMVYLHGYLFSTTPRSIGYFVTAYVVVLVAGGLAFGRRWLAGAEVLSLLARWCGESLVGRLARRQLPRGAECVVGALVGGMLFGELRRSAAWGPLIGTTTDPERAALVGAVLAIALGCGVAWGLQRIADRQDAPGSVAIALIPLVAGLAVATLIRRLLVSAQLVWFELSDPLDRGWNLFGSADSALDPNPFGTTTQRWAAVAIVALTGLRGAWLLARRVPPRTPRSAAGLALTASVVLGVIGVTTTV